MIEFTQGNLIDAEVDALVNTVNTVGIMGKGIALMFKEAFGPNFREYAAACKKNDVRVGEMYVTDTESMIGPRWIINFPTKEHWRAKTKIEWIESGLVDLRRVILDLKIRSIAIPPLGSGNGGLDWAVVKPLVVRALSDLDGVQIQIYEPATQYQNVVKRKGVEKLTPARALIAELVRRYWVLGIEGTILEVQKLAWFLERRIAARGLEDPLNLQFVANHYGPYADRLRHLLDSLDGSYLHCSKRLADAGPMDTIWFDDSRKETIQTFLNSSGSVYSEALEDTGRLIDGFESPLGLELLATVDWLLDREKVEPNVESVRAGLTNWPAGRTAAERKNRIFDDRLLGLAIDRLTAA